MSDSIVPPNQVTARLLEVPFSEPVTEFAHANVASVDARRRESRASLMDFTAARGAREDNGSREELKLLRQHIAMLESTIARSNMTNESTKQRTPTTRTAETPDKDMGQIYLERRKRHRFTTFEKGSAFDAKQWLQRYQVLSQYLGFTDEEKAEELVGVLTGTALDWYIGLDPNVAKSWESVKQAFLRQHALGEDPTLAAFNELETYKQGNNPMKVFGPELKALLQRAGVFIPNIQLNYLRDRLKPELERAVIMARVTNLDDGIRVATDIERSLANKQDATYMGPIRQQHDVYQAYEETDQVKQNYQQQQDYKKHQENKDSDRTKGYKKETRKCYNCQKVGHISKNCWKNKKQQSSQQVNSEEEENIFAHLMLNNHQETEGSYYTGGRFKVEVQVEKELFMRKVLMNTGSTISSISKEVAEELKLETMITPAITISYGNRSQQYTTRKAILPFVFNKQYKSKAYVYIVDKQNEEIINSLIVNLQILHSVCMPATTASQNYCWLNLRQVFFCSKW